MNARSMAVRTGLRRGWIEFRQTTTNVGEMIGWLWLPITALIVMYAVGDNTLPGTDFTVGSQAIPGILGMSLVFTGLMGLAMALTMDREDGTLLRAKATPNGMLGYLIGKVTSRAGLTISVLVGVLIPAAFLFDGLRLGSASAWAALIGVLVLGLLATLPIGAVLGAVFTNAQSLGFITMLIMGLAGISGVFYPITALPEWLQWIAQVFPVYWLGLGMRWALLPDALSVAEIGGSWRHLETLGVLGAWAVFGFVVAPVVLRRMARRESGSSVAANRDKVAQRMA